MMVWISCINRGQGHLRTDMALRGPTCGMHQGSNGGYVRPSDLTAF